MRAHAKAACEYSALIGGTAHSPGADLTGDPAPSATGARPARPKWLKGNPITLLLVGLALAVILWGLEYKLSLYQPHPYHSARVGVAKLWLGPRKAIRLASSGVVKSSVLCSPGLSLTAYSDFSLFHCSNGLLDRTAALLPNAAFLSGQKTPRSPPVV